MLQGLNRWIAWRRAIRRRWQAEALRLVRLDERAAYNEAQRLAARSRARSDAGEFLHWTKVAAEVARIAPAAEMDIDVVQAIVDEELNRHSKKPKRQV